MQVVVWRVFDGSIELEFPQESIIVTLMSKNLQNKAIGM